MFSRFGRWQEAGFGIRGGMGFGFRGSSPPWPYVGIGRGGLPRCGYFLGSPGASFDRLYRYAPFTTRISEKEELDFLKDQAEAIKEQLKEIETRIGELETEKE